MSQSGGLNYSSFASNNTRIKSTVICDVGTKQITWPLLTSIILDGMSVEGFKRIMNYFNSIMNVASISSEENYDAITYAEQLNSQFSNLSNNGFSNMEVEPVSTKRKNIEDISILGAIDNAVNKKMKQFGGSYEEGDVSQPNIDLLNNFDMVFHPLVPIYMLLSPFYYTLDSKYQEDAFFYS